MSRLHIKRTIYGYRSLVILIVLLTGSLACSSAGSTAQDIYPGVEWERHTDPESVGYSLDALETVGAYADTIPSTGLVVVVGGKILYENGNIEDRSYIASVRKSVLAMLYGNYVKDGTVDLSKSLVDLNINDHGGLSDQEREATIGDLIGARSGVYHEASNSGDNLADAPARNSQRHGEYFLYSNWDFNTLGFIFEQETGKNIYDALQTDLVDRIGMQDFDRSTHRKSGDLERSLYPAYHMNISARDLARLGLLMLRGGKWNEEQIVPEAWTKKISSLNTPLEEMNPERTRNGNLGYGYLWWIFDGPEVTGTELEGAYTGVGAGGQYLTVIPKLDMIVTHKNDRRQNGSSLSRRQYYTILDMVISAKN